MILNESKWPLWNPDRIINELCNIYDNQWWINELTDKVWKRTDSLISLKKSSQSKFYLYFMLLFSEELKKENKMNDLDILNLMINDIKNLWSDIENEIDLIVLVWYKADVLEIINSKNKLLESNSEIKKEFYKLIKIIESRIKIINWIKKIN